MGQDCGGTVGHGLAVLPKEKPLVISNCSELGHLQRWPQTTEMATNLLGLQQPSAGEVEKLPLP